MREIGNVPPQKNSSPPPKKKKTRRRRKRKKFSFSAQKVGENGKMVGDRKHCQRHNGPRVLTPYLE